jgi:exodeoxyribonuclease V gamma subunit
MPAMTLGLKVHRGSRGEDLAAALAAVLAQPLGDPLAKDAVVVHSKGLERWLAMQIAARNGVCANVWFGFPGDFLGAAFSAVLGPEADTAGWSRERIAWAILAALPSLQEAAELQPVRDFIAAGEGLDDDRRRVEVAFQIGALFERYATYRPDVVKAWADGAGTGWEPILWRAAAARVPGSDPGGLGTRFQQALDDRGAAALASVPRRVCLFSVSTLPPQTVRLFALLAAHIEVHLFLLTPAEPWWQGLKGIAQKFDGTPMLSPRSLPALPTHPLLESMGKLARDFQLSILGVARQDRLVPSVGPEPPVDTTLRRLQADLRSARLPEAPHLLQTGCRSIQIHSCHGPMRQVQVLRDVLIAAFDELPGLEPRDVLVMAPEIEAFAPLIRAVFDDGAPTWSKRSAHPGGVPRLRFRLADQGVAKANPAADVMLAVLRLAGGRLKAGEVLDLLERDPVRRRFGIASEDLPQARAWALESGIRWAADADHREQVGRAASELDTWRHGLDRLLMGQAVADPDRLLLDVLPHGEVEGKGGRALLGGFVDFAETIIRWSSSLNGSRTLEQWRDTLLSLLDDFVALDHGFGWQLEQVRQGLAEAAEEAVASGFDGVLDRGAVESLLQGRFAISEPGRGFLSGNITFCQLVPMRSIPFRVICLLGMDDGAFPRSSIGLAFDLMEREPRVGDRSVREDDRGLFLEAVLAAGDRLVITYSGRGIRDDRARPAAVPVAELLDVIDQSFVGDDGGRPSDSLVVQHPLQPFSPLNFSPRPGDARSFGVDSRQREAAESWRRGRSAAGAAGFAPFLASPVVDRPAPAPAGDEPLELDWFCRFFKDPLDAFCRSRLGLWPSDEAVATQDREPLEAPRQLVAWALRDQLLQDALAGVDLARPGDAWQRLRQRPGLPLGMPGEVAYDELSAEAVEIAGRVMSLRGAGGEAERVVNLAVGGRELVGRVGGLYGAARVEHRAGSVRDEHILQAWVRHLALAAVGFEGDTWLVGRRSGCGLAAVDGEDALQHLADLVRFHALGRRTPLLFFPEASRGSAQLALWDGEPDTRPKDRVWPPRFGCPWRERFLGWADPFEASFSSPALVPDPSLAAPVLAERVWGPVLAHLQELPS